MTEVVAERRWLLPTYGGHDLSPARDARILFVTTNPGVYCFDIGMGEFKPHVELGKFSSVKSIDEHLTTGRIVYHQADPNQNGWWSNAVRLLEPTHTIVLPGERLYKVRWHVQHDLR